TAGTGQGTRAAARQGARTRAGSGDRRLRTRAAATDAGGPGEDRRGRGPVERAAPGRRFGGGRLRRGEPHGGTAAVSGNGVQPARTAGKGLRVRRGARAAAGRAAIDSDGPRPYIRSMSSLERVLRNDAAALVAVTAELEELLARESVST